MSNYTDTLIEELLNEILVEDNNQDTIKGPVYHYFSSLPDLVNSLRTNCIYSNKNEQSSQHDYQAKKTTIRKGNYADYFSGRKDDEAYVCFTTFDGDNGVKDNLDRPFGMSLSEKGWDALSAKYECKTYSQVYSKISHRGKFTHNKDERGEDLEIFAVGKLAKEAGGDYFISVGQGSRGIWSARRFPKADLSTEEGKKQAEKNENLYKLLKNWFLYNITDGGVKDKEGNPTGVRTIYHFEDLQNGWGVPVDWENQLTAEQIEQLKNTGYLQTDTATIYQPEKNPNTNHNNRYIINTTKNKNQSGARQGYVPRKDLPGPKDKNNPNAKVAYNATIAFPIHSKKYEEVIGCGPVVWNKGARGSKSAIANGDIDYVKPDVAGGYTGLELFGADLSKSVPQFFDPEVEDPLTRYKDTRPGSIGTPTGYKKLALDKNSSTAFCELLDEHEVRVYIPGKANLYFNADWVEHINLPSKFIARGFVIDLFGDNGLLQKKTDGTIVLNEKIPLNGNKVDTDSFNIKNILSMSRASKEEHSYANQPDEVNNGDDSDDLNEALLEEDLDDLTVNSLIELCNLFLTNKYNKENIVEVAQVSGTQIPKVSTLGFKQKEETIDKEFNMPTVLSTGLTVNKNHRYLTTFKPTTIASNLKYYNPKVAGSTLFIADPKNGKPRELRAFNYGYTDTEVFTVLDNVTVQKTVYDQHGNEVPDKDGKTEDGNWPAVTRLGAECIIIGLKRTKPDEITTEPYILMVHKPGKSNGFFELPGGGLDRQYGTEDLSIPSVKKSLMAKLQKKVGMSELEGEAAAGLGSKIKTITDPEYTEQAVFYSEKVDKKSRFDAAYYYLFTAFYKGEIDNLDIYDNFGSTDYDSYLVWFPINSLNTNTEFQRRYSEIKPIIDGSMGVGSAKYKAIKEDVEEKIKKELEDKTKPETTKVTQINNKMWDPNDNSDQLTTPLASSYQTGLYTGTSLLEAFSVTGDWTEEPMLFFEEAAPIKPGTRVELKPEWMDTGDENYIFTVVEDRDDRVVVEMHRKDGKDPSIIPTQTIGKFMLKDY